MYHLSVNTGTTELCVGTAQTRAPPLRGKLWMRHSGRASFGYGFTVSQRGREL